MVSILKSNTSQEVRIRPADALSRKNGDVMDLAAFSIVKVSGLDAIADEVLQDEKLQVIVQGLLSGDSKYFDFSLRNGSLLYRGRLVLSKQSALK